MAYTFSSLAVLWKREDQQEDLKYFMADPLMWAMDELKRAKEADSSEGMDIAVDMIEFIIKECAP